MNNNKIAILAAELAKLTNEQAQLKNKRPSKYKTGR
jgi:hypothetical protein